MGRPLYTNGVTSSAPNPTFLRGGEDTRVAANVQAGPSVLGIDVQSPLMQVAAKSALNRQDIRIQSEAATVGPYTGLISNFKVLPGVYSQMAARIESLDRSVVNLTQRTAQLESKESSLAASEAFFWATLENGLNRAGEHNYSLEKAPTAEFARELARVTDGVLSTNDLIESINSGEMGFTSYHSLAQYKRLDPTGVKRTTRRS